MPSLFRFLTVVAIIGGIGYGIIFVTIPPDKFLKK